MRPSLREGVWIVILPTLSHRAIRALDVHQSLLYSSQKVAAFSAGVTCKVFSSSWCRNLLGYASLAQSLALVRPDRTLRFPPSLILTCAPGFVAILTAGSGIASMAHRTIGADLAGLRARRWP